MKKFKINCQEFDVINAQKEEICYCFLTRFSSPQILFKDFKKKITLLFIVLIIIIIAVFFRGNDFHVNILFRKKFFFFFKLADFFED